MSRSSLCSVVVPAFNAERYLEDTIHSVVEQSHPSWELLVVDDGSTDRTLEVAKAIQHPRVRVFTQANRGAAAARNRGLRESEGQYVVFLDADDRLRPTALARFVEALQNTPRCVVAYGEIRAISAEGDVLDPRPPRPGGGLSGDLLRALLVRNRILTPGAACVRRSGLAEVGPFDERLKVGEDWELWCRLAGVGEFRYIGGEPVTDYRIHPESMVHTAGLDIAHEFACIDAIYSNPKLEERFDEATRARYRRRSDATAHSFVADRHIKARDWRRAREHLARALRSDPWRAREILILPFCVFRWMPKRIERSIM
jgi:glycosyltransferase involved in cell wall biosynthesis